MVPLRALTGGLSPSDRRMTGAEDSLASQPTCDGLGRWLAGQRTQRYDGIWCLNMAVGHAQPQGQGCTGGEEGGGGVSGGRGRTPRLLGSLASRDGGKVITNKNVMMNAEEIFAAQGQRDLFSRKCNRQYLGWSTGRGGGRGEGVWREGGTLLLRTASPPAKRPEPRGPKPALQTESPRALPRPPADRSPGSAAAPCGAEAGTRTAAAPRCAGPFCSRRAPFPRRRRWRRWWGWSNGRPRALRWCPQRPRGWRTPRRWRRWPHLRAWDCQRRQAVREMRNTPAISGPAKSVLVLCGSSMRTPQRSGWLSIITDAPSGIRTGDLLVRHQALLQ